MRDYGSVSPKFWLAGTGRELRGDPEAQVVALYLMTSPHATMTGVYHVPRVYIAHETGMPLEGASKALRRLIEAGFCAYDEATETVFVYRMAAYQVAEALKPSDKRVKAIRREVEQMPQNALRTRFLQVYGDAFHVADMLTSEGPPQAPSDAPQKLLRSHEQEQEQEQEQDSRAPAPRETPAEYREHWLTIQARYPKAPTRGNWILAEHHALRLVTEGQSTWPQLEAQVAAYAAYCRATGTMVAPPERFFDQDGKDRWAGDWTVPRRERTDRPELEAGGSRIPTDAQRAASDRAALEASARAYGIDPAGRSEAEINNAIFERKFKTKPPGRAQGMERAGT